MRDSVQRQSRRSNVSGDNYQLHNFMSGEVRESHDYHDRMEEGQETSGRHQEYHPIDQTIDEHGESRHLESIGDDIVIPDKIET
jgi:hypothetical protein